MITTERIAELRAMQERLGNEGTGCWRNPVVDELLDAAEVVPELLEALKAFGRADVRHAPYCAYPDGGDSYGCACGLWYAAQLREAALRKARGEDVRPSAN